MNGHGDSDNGENQANDRIVNQNDGYQQRGPQENHYRPADDDLVLPPMV